LRVDVSTRCPNMCSGRGNCNAQAVCSCPNGFAGSGCENSKKGNVFSFHYHFI